MAVSDYRKLNISKIRQTTRSVDKRVSDTFPNSSLSGISATLVEISKQATINIGLIKKPNMYLRIALGIAFLIVVGFSVKLGTLLHTSDAIYDLSDFLQAVNAGAEIVVFLGVIIVFLFSLETRVKRHKALSLLAELRALAHLVDLHHIAKEHPVTPGGDLQVRIPLYFNLCCEILSLVSIIAALYVQELEDEVAIQVAEDIEDLTTGLSQKIWQKATLIISKK